MAEDNNGMGLSITARDIALWVLWFIIALIVSIVLNSMFVISIGISSNSMEETIMTNGQVLGSKVSYTSGNPERFDIVILQSQSESGSNTYVGRIIGMPEETVKIVSGKAYVNADSSPLDEPYLTEGMSTSAGPFIVPKDCYFVVGDNRNSSEGRGIISKEDIIGKAFISVYPKINFLK